MDVHGSHRGSGAGLPTTRSGGRTSAACTSRRTTRPSSSTRSCRPRTPSGSSSTSTPTWSALGADVHILLTVYWHVRSATELAKRYDAAVWAPARSALPGRTEDEAVAQRRPARRPATRRARSIRVRPRGGARLPPTAAARDRRRGRAARRSPSDLPTGLGRQGRPAGRSQGAATAARGATRPRARLAR